MIRRVAPLALSVLAASAGCETRRGPGDAAVAPPSCALRTPERFRPETPRAAREQAFREHLVRCGRERTVELARALIAFPTVRGPEGAPLPPAFAAMGEHLARFASETGLRFENHGPDEVWELSLGSGEPSLGFLLHGDVVPAGDLGAALPEGWSVPPFRAEVRDGRLYGRGSEDDKGPIAGVLVLLEAMRHFDVGPGGRVSAIIGTGEESNWDGMRAYAAAAKAPAQLISVDAAFPLVVAESGFVSWHLGGPEKRTRGAKRARIEHARAGEFLTQVPGRAEMTLRPAQGETASALASRVRRVAEAKARARGRPYTAEITRDGERVRLQVSGEAIHSSEADDGASALWLLAEISAELNLEPTLGAALLRLVAVRMVDDHYGRKLGLAYADPLMGPLLVAPTLLAIDEKQASLGVNMRRPRGKDRPEFERSLEAALVAIQGQIDPRIGTLEPAHVGDPALAETSGPLASVLLDVYRRHQNAPSAEPISIRGGTYARLFKGAVSFGPAFPGSKYRGHAADEYITIEALEALVNMLGQAVLELGTSAEPAAKG